MRDRRGHLQGAAGCGTRARGTREGLTNVELVKADALNHALPRESFDLVHVRFMFTPLGRDEALLEAPLALTRPGGVLVTQEADECAYICQPPQPAWDRLKALTAAAFERAGGDVNAGRRMYRLLRNAGLQDVSSRAAALALPGGAPFPALADRVRDSEPAANQRVGPDLGRRVRPDGRRM